MNLIIAVAVGGAIGAVGRYLVSGIVIQQMGTQFPWSTLTVNIVGSLLMGILAETMKLTWSPTPEIKAIFFIVFCFISSDSVFEFLSKLDIFQVIF